LRQRFFARLQLMFYAGAGLAQHVWDELDAMAVATVGERVTMLAGFGATETAPFCLIARPDAAQAGKVGLPARGVELKLLPNAGKLEARVRGPNITPGYWRDENLTRDAFDEEGFYRLGDALAWVDPDRPELGLRFDGRISEDFKLSTGTWVSVGTLRSRLIAGLSPFLRDAVIAGLDRDYVAALLVPDPAACAAFCDGGDWPSDARLHAALAASLRRLADTATGSSTRVRRACLLHAPLDIDAGEVTDKGSINQRAVLRQRASLVAELFAEPPLLHIISIED
jgi:feruloyl-CoA synthase